MLPLPLASNWVILDSLVIQLFSTKPIKTMLTGMLVTTIRIDIYYS
jgi:hypothetical protein